MNHTELLRVTAPCVDRFLPSNSEVRLSIYGETAPWRRGSQNLKKTD